MRTDDDDNNLAMDDNFRGGWQRFSPLPSLPSPLPSLHRLILTMTWTPTCLLLYLWFLKTSRATDVAGMPLPLSPTVAPPVPFWSPVPLTDDTSRSKYRTISYNSHSRHWNDRKKIQSLVTTRRSSGLCSSEVLLFCYTLISDHLIITSRNCINCSEADLCSRSVIF